MFSNASLYGGSDAGIGRDAFFPTKNDTEFAGLALYLSKRQMRVQKRRVFSETQTVVYSHDLQNVRHLR
jgi:hypothetical protein